MLLIKFPYKYFFQGHRTLNDLTEKENLSKQQAIGVKYYNEFLERIPKNEVEEIGQKVNIKVILGLHCYFKDTCVAFRCFYLTLLLFGSFTELCILLMSFKEYIL